MPVDIVARFGRVGLTAGHVARHRRSLLMAEKGIQAPPPLEISFFFSLSRYHSQEPRITSPAIGFLFVVRVQLNGCFDGATG